MESVAETFPLSIQKLTLKGYGLGYTSTGKEVEIAHAIPGDEALIAYKKKKRPPQKGRLLEVLQASQNRVETLCRHARVCGGCCWQQMAYEAQLAEKKRRVEEAFQHRFPVEPILAAEHPFGYRNKMEFTFSQNRGGQRFLGLMIAQAEPYVFDLSECFLGPAWFAEAVQAARRWWEVSGLQAYCPSADTGSLRYLTLRAGWHTGQKMAVLNVSGNPTFALQRAHLEEFVSAMRSICGDGISLFLRIHQTKKGKPTQFYEMHLFGPDHLIEELHLRKARYAFKISPSSFFQPNTLQAEKLYDAALQILGEAQCVFDLYSGTGALAMASSSMAKKVIGIELSKESVLDAEENLARNGIENVSMYQGDVGEVLTAWMGQSDFARPDAVLIDPPRAGLDPLALRHLKSLLPKKIIYISCNPITQAANIEELLKSDYRLEKLQPVDQFPHTYHIENIALLTKNLSQ